VRLHRERRARGSPDGSTEQHVVREHDVGRQELAERRRIRVDVCVELGGSEVLEQLRV